MLKMLQTEQNCLDFARRFEPVIFWQWCHQETGVVHYLCSSVIHYPYKAPLQQTIPNSSTKQTHQLPTFRQTLTFVEAHARASRLSMTVLLSLPGTPARPWRSMPGWMAWRHHLRTRHPSAPHPIPRDAGTAFQNSPLIFYPESIWKFHFGNLRNCMVIIFGAKFEISCVW